MITLAQEAARRAGDVLRENFGRDLVVERKGQADFVTDVDRRAEEVLREFLSAELPDHAFLMEESGASGGASEWTWIVDPLDGTTNYIHRYPFFCVSLALRHRGQIVLGVVYDPLRGETFTAEAGEPARLNGIEIRTSRVGQLDAALVCTGFPFRSRQYLEPYLGLFREVFQRAGGLRRDGSAALDLAYVAVGRYDAFFELGLKPWDVAAGELLVRQAGGQVSDFHGGPGALEQGDVLASNGLLQAELLALARAEFPGERPRG